VKEKPRCISYLQKKNRSYIDSAPALSYHNYTITIKKAKAKDLRKLVANYVPRDYHYFYANMPTTDDGDNSDDDI
jgi:hypothetical protein